MNYVAHLIFALFGHSSGAPAAVPPVDAAVSRPAPAVTPTWSPDCPDNVVSIKCCPQAQSLLDCAVARSKR